MGQSPGQFRSTARRSLDLEKSLLFRAILLRCAPLMYASKPLRPRRVERRAVVFPPAQRQADCPATALATSLCKARMSSNRVQSCPPTGCSQFGVDELQGDTDLVTRLPHRAFEECRNHEEFTNLPDRRVGVTETHDRGAGDDLIEGRNLGKGRDQLPMETINEIGLLRVAGEIFERQQGDGSEV